jgi:hypothetical protein
MEAKSVSIPSAGRCQNDSIKIRGNSSPSLGLNFIGKMLDKTGKQELIDIFALLEPTIKYESPYSTTPPVYDTQQANLKRRASDIANEMRESDGKRQRIEVPVANDDLDLASIIAQATATAERTFAESTLQGGQPSNPNTNGQGGLIAFREQGIALTSNSI